MHLCPSEHADRLCGSSQTHLGTSMPSGGGHIIRALERGFSPLQHSGNAHVRAMTMARYQFIIFVTRDASEAALVRQPEIM